MDGSGSANGPISFSGSIGKRGDEAMLNGKERNAMNIRVVTEGERDFVREQRLNAYLPYAARISAEHWQGLSHSLSSDADRQNGAELLVAEIDGRIAGSVVLFPPRTDAYDGLVDAADVPEIRMLAVDSDYRGRGVASALIDACVERARAQGFRAIGLHTGEFMTPARRLYEKLGFARVPELDFVPIADGIVVMGYRLSI